MRIVVCVRQVCDPATVRVSRSREELDLRGAARITNPADRYALEAALRLRSVRGGDVIAVTAGDAGAEDVLHEAIAMGADYGMLLTGPELSGAGSAPVTAALAAALRRLMPVDLVLTGSLGATDGTGSLAARLAAELGWPIALDAVRLAANGPGVVATRLSDDGGAVLAPLALPAVVAILPGAERPRYPHAARIANAWRPGQVEVCTAADLGLDGGLIDDVATGGLVLAPERQRGQVLGGAVDEAAAGVLEILRAKRILRDA